MVSHSTGRIVPKTCKRWTCSECNVWLRAGARNRLIEGAARTPSEDFGLGFLTLTDTARGDLDFGGLARQWRNLAAAMRRRGWLAGYCSQIELQKRDALHPHVLCRVPLDVMPYLRVGERRDKRQYGFHFNELVPLVRDAGFGQVCDFKRVHDLTGAVNYAVKSLAGYATKGTYERFKDAGAHRIRPQRASTDWTPGRTLKDFQQGQDADAGPWLDVTNVCG